MKTRLTLLLFCFMMLSIPSLRVYGQRRPISPPSGKPKPPKPTTGTLSISSTPSGAVVKIGGKYMGETPFTLEKQKPGSYSITFSAEGYESQTKSVSVTAGKTATCSVMLENKVKVVVYVTLKSGNMSGGNGCTIYFDEGKATLDNIAKAKLNTIEKGATIIVDGYAFPEDVRAKSLEMSQRCCDAVKTYLEDRGVFVAKAVVHDVESAKHVTNSDSVYSSPSTLITNEQLYKEGQKYYEGGDYSKAIPCFRNAAEQGNALAQFNLGCCYEKGQGVAQNYTEAVSWYRKAATQGLALAQYNLGVCYYEGQGVTQSYSDAVSWFRKAAERGVARAPYYLGYCYSHSLGVTQSYTEAVSWYRKAAEQGDSDAQYNLGRCYERGQGVTQSYSEAVYWYRKAAEQGDASAQYDLGVCYDEGKGISQSYSNAVSWYRKAAEQGDPWAQHKLGECYYYGRGVATDKQEAKKYFERSAAKGIVYAKDALDNYTF